MINVHKTEKDIMQYETCGDQHQKLKILSKLRKLGNFKHNERVMEIGKGTLSVMSRPKISATKTQTANYVPCTYCFGYYKKRDLWRHAKRCKQGLGQSASKSRENCVSNGKLLMKTKDTSEQASVILSTLRDDEVSLVIKSDRLLLRLAAKMAKKHSFDKSRYNYMRNTLRQLAKLLMRLKRIRPDITSLEEFIDPMHFQDVIEAVRLMVGQDLKTNQIVIPSLALKMSGYLKKCCAVLRSEAMKQYDDAKFKKIKRFNCLIYEEWDSEFTSNALRNLNELQKNKVKLLPLTEDVAKLSNFLKREIYESYRCLSTDNENCVAYQQLQKLILAMIILFNRRRCGEVSKMKLEDYHSSHAGHQFNDFGLSEFEKELAKRLKRLEITGKRGRTVPVLLTKQISNALDLIVECRKNTTISKENSYIFANSSPSGHFRGTDVLRYYSEKCGAIRPDALRSTKLRKEIASATQILNLAENELDILASFMGHDIRIHREYYRLPQESLQVAKVSRILFAMENGTMSNLSNKRLDDIEVNLDEEFEGKSSLFLAN